MLLCAMSYTLSFSPDFLQGNHPGGSEDLQQSDRPTSVKQALLSLKDETWTRLARDVFGCEPQYLDIDAVMRTIVKTNTCRNLDPPVDVLIDPKGEFSVLVYDRSELGVDSLPLPV